MIFSVAFVHPPSRWKAENGEEFYGNLSCNGCVFQEQDEMQQTLFVPNNRYKRSKKYEMEFQDWMINTGRKMIPMICYLIDSIIKHDLRARGLRESTSK